MKIRTLKQLFIEYTEINMNDKYVFMDEEVKEAIGLYQHLKCHPEVIHSPINPGEPMCKICNKTAKQIIRE